MAASKILVATGSFMAATRDGQTVVVPAGARLASTDPIVKAHPHHVRAGRTAVKHPRASEALHETSGRTPSSRPSARGGRQVRDRSGGTQRRPPDRSHAHQGAEGAGAPSSRKAKVSVHPASARFSPRRAKARGSNRKERRKHRSTSLPSWPVSRLSLALSCRGREGYERLEPCVPVTFTGPRDQCRTVALVDSGADRTTLRSSGHRGSVSTSTRRRSSKCCT
jgi:hypothetical protein